MLEIRPICENCSKKLPYNSTEAMICNFECTFCSDCANEILQNVCPNCGGGFEKRPIRPREKLIKSPIKTEEYFKPIDHDRFEILLAKNRDIMPSER